MKVMFTLYCSLSCAIALCPKKKKKKKTKQKTSVGSLIKNNAIGKMAPIDLLMKDGHKPLICKRCRIREV